MERMARLLIVECVLMGCVGNVWAADQGGSTGGSPVEQKVTASSVAGTSTPAAQSTPPAPAVQPITSMPPARSTISTVAVEGSIVALDLQASTPTLKLRAADGKMWTLALDPKTTAVWKDGQMAKLDQLKSGQLVKVRHEMKNSRDLAQSIRISADAKPMASTSKPKTQGY